MERSERIAGCLLGGAVGDALGAPVEFMSIGEIRSQFGINGIEHYAPAYGRTGTITDDTQMALFTLEGLLSRQGDVSLLESVRYAYIRWLGTQGTVSQAEALSSIYTGRLWQVKALHSNRAPGNACLSSLKAHLSRMEASDFLISDESINDSKGCGGVMRMAPVGFFDLDCFMVGCMLAKLTHGNPSGYFASGFLAHLISELLNGSDLADAIESARSVLIRYTFKKQVLNAVDLAVGNAKTQEPTPELIESFGGGWVAEEALAISLFCALKAENFAHGIRMAVNHSGDSDSTGAITGNILGAMWGRSAIPDEFLQDLEMRPIIEEMALDAASVDSPDGIATWKGMDYDNSYMLIACESPTYFSEYFGFGETRSRTHREMTGTTCIIGGATLANYGVIRPVGLMRAWLASPTWLIPEAIIAWLAERLDSVILVQESMLNDSFVESARRSGMSVMGKPRCIVCHGSGKAMQEIHWLNQNPGQRTSLIAFSKEGKILEREFIQKVRRGLDVFKMLDSFRVNGWFGPDNRVDSRDHCCLGAWLGGYWEADVVINTTLADSAAIKQQCAKQAARLGVALYDAGSIEDLKRVAYFNSSRIYCSPSSLWTRIA